jgi:regulator of protease activity HflC (stomatin/prohibitin superfamily)
MTIPVIAAAAKARRENALAGTQTRHLDENVRGGGRRYLNSVSATAFMLLLVTAIFFAVQESPRIAVALIGVAFLALFGIKIAKQWERAVVLRFGKFQSLRGPGLFFVIPIVDEISHLIDQRMRVTDVTAESTLTHDTVPVDVDAIVFWTVWDAQKAVLEVSDYFVAVSLSAQTALRESIGRAELAALIAERERLGHELRTILDEKTNAWGITVHSVEIRDVRIPQELEDAMSRQAQAERERQARIILGTAETEIASRFVAAGAEYENRPVALHLRAMNMLYEALKEKGSMVIVPSSAVETMGLGGLSGLTALGGGAVPGASGAPIPATPESPRS